MRSSPSNADLARALAGFRTALAAISTISGVVNVLALTGAFYMLQVYDRVLTSHSVPTLVALSVLAIGLYVFQGTLDVLRGQALVRLGSRLDRRLAPLAHNAVVALPLAGASPTAALQPLRDIDAMRAFLASQGPVALLELPWIPAYIAFVVPAPSWLGALALGGTALLIAFTWITERLTRPLNAAATHAATQRASLAEGNARNAEVLSAMGFAGRAADRFARANVEHLSLQARASDIGGGLGGLSRVLPHDAAVGNPRPGPYLTIRGEVAACVGLLAGRKSLEALIALIRESLPSLAPWRANASRRS